MEKIKNLLEEVKSSIIKYEKIAKVKGENFNLFEILDRKTDEVKTHSAMIAELLNPKGSHDMGEQFLLLFIDMINSMYSNTIGTKYKKISTEKLYETQVYIEENIGQISHDLCNGGRIDILLGHDNFKICIENKIDAIDQKYQLIRYHNYLKNDAGKNTLLLYLTKDGKEASEISVVNNAEKNKISLSADKDYYRISYNLDILNWIEKCILKSTSKPIVKESLCQYSILIKNITNQSKSKEMENEIKQLIIKNIESSEIIKNTFDAAIFEIACKFRDAVLSNIQKEYQSAYGFDHPNRRNISIFIPIQGGLLGVESFTGNGDFNDSSLFVNILQKNEKDIWVWAKHYERILSKKDLYLHIQKFSENQVESDIPDKIANKIFTYINAKVIQVLDK